MNFGFFLPAVFPERHGLALPDGASGAISLSVPYPAQLHIPGVHDDKADCYLTAYGFATEEEARSTGQAAKSALRIAALVADTPVDISLQFDRMDRPRPSLSVEVQDRIRPLRDSPLNNPFDILEVFEDTGHAVRPTWSYLTFSSATDASKFAEPLQRALNVHRLLSSIEELAIDTYFLAYFELSIRAGILALITVLEILAKRESRTGVCLELASTFIEQVRDARTSAPPEEQTNLDSLVGGLRDLRNQSISSSVGRLARENVHHTERFGDGESPEQFSKRCYNIRSRMVHGGEEPEGIAQQAFRDDLNRLVRLVLLGVLNLDSR